MLVLQNFAPLISAPQLTLPSKPLLMALPILNNFILNFKLFLSLSGHLIKHFRKTFLSENTRSKNISNEYITFNLDAFEGLLLQNNSIKRHTHKAKLNKTTSKLRNSPLFLLFLCFLIYAIIFEALVGRQIEKEETLEC